MIIYIDNDFKCHTTNNGSFISVETNFFNDKCNTFIEGYRFIPFGSIWTREDGSVFTGEMIAPWKSSFELEQAQYEYEQQLYTEQNQAMKILFGEVE